MNRIRYFAVTTAICLGTFMATQDISIVNVALPAIQHELNTSMVSLQWLIDAYALCLSALILSAGPLSDRWGRKKMWLTGVVIFTLGSLLCALAGSLTLLLAGRIVQGIAAALLIPGALSLITQRAVTLARGRNPADAEQLITGTQGQELTAEVQYSIYEAFAGGFSLAMAGAALSAAWVFILIFYPRHHKIRQENGKITS